MPSVSHRKREVLFKIVYYGPGLGGKTTNLEYIHAHSRPDHRGKLLSLNTAHERTLFFDLLPIDLGEFKGYQVRLHLCTVPGQIAYDRTRRLILRGVDGVVFVVDSQPAQLDANVESLENLAANLRWLGIEPNRTPVVVQYNKRDLHGVLDPVDLRAAIGIPKNVPQLEASARYGKGVFETLKRITRECLRVVGDPQQLKEGRSPSIIPGHRPSMYPEALVGRKAQSAESDHSVTLPRAPRIPNVPGAGGQNRG